MEMIGQNKESVLAVGALCTRRDQCSGTLRIITHFGPM